MWRPRSGEHLSILFDVFALGQEVRTLLGAAMRDAGMRPDEYAAYSVVFEDGPTTLTAMARTLGMPVTTAADYVKAMAARRHLRRRVNPADQRSQLLSLTAAGHRAHERAGQCFELAYQALRRELAPLEEYETRRVLQALSGSAHRASVALSGGTDAGVPR
jgi:DNA-binding MarR family transcriptional regulator